MKIIAKIQIYSEIWYGTIFFAGNSTDIIPPYKTDMQTKTRPIKPDVNYIEKNITT
jgi:hypothetical protein